MSRAYGTRPYLPAEFLQFRKLTTKVDSYSFGIVLFEIATGLRAYDSRNKSYLVNTIKSHNKDGKFKKFNLFFGSTFFFYVFPLFIIGKLIQLIDKTASGEAADEQRIFKIIIDLGLNCTKDYEERLNMSEVSKYFHGPANQVTLLDINKTSEIIVLRENEKTTINN